MPLTPQGVPEHMRPYCPVDLTTQSFELIARNVRTVLVNNGMSLAAQEFDTILPELDEDLGMLWHVAQAFVCITEEESEGHDE